MAYSEDAELGHAFAVPFDLVIGKRDIPVIPFFTNVYVPPLPTAQRCAAFGKALADIVKGRKERVAIIASGGMSHFPGTTKYLHPEFDFDRWLVSQFEAGNPDALLNMTNPQLDEVGQHRDAELGGRCSARSEQLRRADRLHSDLASRSVDDAVHPGETAKDGADASRPSSSVDSSSRTRRFQFYKHPPAEAYGLNKLLFESRHSAELRNRILSNFDAVAKEYELAPPQRKAAEEMINVGQGRPGQRACRSARRSRRASPPGSVGAPRHLLDEPSRPEPASQTTH